MNRFGKSTILHRNLVYFSRTNFVRTSPVFSPCPVINKLRGRKLSRGQIADEASGADLEALLTKYELLVQRLFWSCMLVAGRGWPLQIGLFKCKN